jgi:hypothetical protein
LPAANAPNSDGTDIGAFEAQTAPDNPPTAAANVTTAGGTTYTFTVTYSDDLGLNVSSIVNNNAAVRVTGPNGFNAAATYVVRRSLLLSVHPHANRAGLWGRWRRALFRRSS